MVHGQAWCLPETWCRSGLGGDPFAVGARPLWRVEGRKDVARTVRRDAGTRLSMKWVTITPAAAGLVANRSCGPPARWLPSAGGDNGTRAARWRSNRSHARRRQSDRCPRDVLACGWRVQSSTRGCRLTRGRGCNARWPWSELVDRGGLGLPRMGIEWWTSRCPWASVLPSGLGNRSRPPVLVPPPHGSPFSRPGPSKPDRQAIPAPGDQSVE